MTPLMFLIETIRTKEGAVLRNKPIHRPGTRSMGFLVCAAMMGGVRIKTSLKLVIGSLDCGIQKTLEAVFAIPLEKCMDLNRDHRRDRLCS